MALGEGEILILLAFGLTISHPELDIDMKGYDYLTKKERNTNRYVDESKWNNPLINRLTQFTNVIHWFTITISNDKNLNFSVAVFH